MRVMIGVKHLAVVVKELGNALLYVNESSQTMCVLYMCVRPGVSCQHRLSQS